MELQHGFTVDGGGRAGDRLPLGTGGRLRRQIDLERRLMDFWSVGAFHGYQ